jgi:glycine/D-amino acid oxidase-like deaminating enzyme
MRVVICGGGVIGASIAYFLSRRGLAPILVERTGIACAASGKSGGFLALDWCDGTPLQELARRSFALHAELAQSLDHEWGYRRLTTYAGLARAVGPRADSDGGRRPWLSEAVSVRQRLGRPETTAQIHPGQFTAAMLAAAEAHGAQLRLGTVTQVLRDGARVKGVMVDGERLDADAVVLALGPWSMRAADGLPMPPVLALKGHSLIFATGDSVPAEALFLDYEEKSRDWQSPEVFPRADGTTYVCAISSESPLPADPGDVAPDPGAIERLEAIARHLSPILARAPILARQACFRPVTLDGLPLIGTLPGLDGIVIASGHSVWGMLNAPATAEAVAELLADGRARTLDLSAFDPGRMASHVQPRRKPHA